MRRSTPSTWEATESGWRYGSYAVTFLGPGEWALESSGKAVSTHGRASDAAAEANVAERTRRRRRTLLRNVGAIVAALVVLAVAQAGRTIPNVAFEPAERYAADLEAVYRSVESGVTPIDEVTGKGGLIGGAFESELALDLGGGPVPPRSYVAITGTHAGECYVIRWTPGGAVFSGVLAGGLPCEPDPRLTQPELFFRAASQSPNAAAFTWTEVLPPERFQARWFVPLLLAMLYVILQSCIGITLAFIRQPRRLIPPLQVGLGDRPAPRVASST
ncbi:MAG: hypothetical protein QNJ88_15490 [Acidimicrobiia bacterium]|nr:hypothetical protein [Acidimicrobiia bacterium]